MNDFKLDNEPKITSGFTVPENYFENFSEKVMLQLPKQEPKVISIWEKNKRWLYATAAVVVLSLSIPIMNVIKNDSDEVNATEVENYLSYHSTLTDDDIVELLDSEDLDKLTITNTIEDKEIEDVLKDNTNLEQYITN
jgi:hypothetical protein